jgi:hypothetical protein
MISGAAVGVGVPPAEDRASPAPYRWAAEEACPSGPWRGRLVGGGRLWVGGGSIVGGGSFVVGGIAVGGSIVGGVNVGGGSMVIVAVGEGGGSVALGAGVNVGAALADLDSGQRLVRPPWRWSRSGAAYRSHSPIRLYPSYTARHRTPALGFLASAAPICSAFLPLPYSTRNLRNRPIGRTPHCHNPCR